jgi:hypothetical protein
MRQRIKLIAVVCAILTLGIATVLVVTNHPTTDTQIERPAKFVLSSWSYPDEYGQGIDRIYFDENSTGDWVNVGSPAYPDGRNNIIDWNASVFIRLNVWCWLNSTLVGIDNTNEGKLYIRHNVTVVQNNGTIVFSQQNFTYSNAYPDADPMFYYSYNEVLNFVPVAGEIYTVTVTYEVYGVFA